MEYSTSVENENFKSWKNRLSTKILQNTGVHPDDLPDFIIEIIMIKITILKILIQLLNLNIKIQTFITIGSNILVMDIVNLKQ